VKILKLAIHLAEHMAGVRLKGSIKLAAARSLALDFRQHTHSASLAEENYKAFANGAWVLGKFSGDAAAGGKG